IVERVLLGSVIERPLQPGKQPNRMPTQRANLCRGNFGLLIAESQRLPKATASLRRAQRFQRHGVEPRAAQAGGCCVEKLTRKIQPAECKAAVRGYKGT